ncbi:MAG: LicD family protein [Lachnospiraceae bacterium]|nr:LicD family protein [Lachnospiraceae bacterium]
MRVPDSFLESEIREGFYIPSFMKRSWAATLEVLQEIMAVCERHDLTWWMDWGSLLATVRHGGFIPWDDDLDISMMRKDYMLFQKYAETELPEGYFLNNIYHNPAFDEYHTRVVNSFDINRGRDFLSKHYGFPYLAGVDIFCIDYVNPDPELDDQLCQLIYTIGSVATGLEPSVYLKDAQGSPLEGALKDIEAMCFYTFSEDEPLRQQINKLCETLMQNTKEEEAVCAACMVNHATRKGFTGVFPKEFYWEFITLPYEFLTVPVPLHYDQMLRTIFGNYMMPYRGGGLHTYPYYETQEQELLTLFGRTEREEYRFLPD